MPLPLQDTVSQVDLPVFDISNFPEDFDAQELKHLQYRPLLAKLGTACQELGFFQLVNHGIPVDLLERAENVCRDLLSVPTEVKDRTLTTGNQFNTYSRNRNFESFRVREPTSPASIKQMCAKIWPEGNPIFCETMSTYALSVSSFEKKVTKIILASLGLDANAFYHSHFEKCASVLRINGYSSEKLSIGDEALYSHTDLSCLTILYQDDVGGLQIRSQEGEWLDVQPLPHSFVIIVGDSLKAWSNGRYRSAEHRVVYKGWRDRMSIGFFTTFPEEMEIWAPLELVDDDNPRRFKPFIYSHFKQEAVSNKEKDYIQFLPHYDVFPRESK